MSVFAASISDATVRRTIVGMCIVLGIAMPFFLILRTWEGYIMQRAVAVHELRLTTLESELRTLKATDERRIDMLESFVFGTVAAEIQTKQISPEVKIVETPAWSKNRDRVLMERITRLEQWRLAQQKEDEK